MTNIKIVDLPQIFAWNDYYRCSSV